VVDPGHHKNTSPGSQRYDPVSAVQDGLGDTDRAQFGHSLEKELICVQAGRSIRKYVIRPPGEIDRVDSFGTDEAIDSNYLLISQGQFVQLARADVDELAPGEFVTERYAADIDGPMYRTNFLML